MAWYLWFILGLIIGLIGGVLLVGLCRSAAWADENIERYLAEDFGSRGDTEIAEVKNNG